MTQKEQGAAAGGGADGHVGSRMRSLYLIINRTHTTKGQQQEQDEEMKLEAEGGSSDGNHNGGARSSNNNSSSSSSNERPPRRGATMATSPDRGTVPSVLAVPLGGASTTNTPGTGGDDGHGCSPSLHGASGSMSSSRAGSPSLSASSSSACQHRPPRHPHPVFATMPSHAGHLHRILSMNAAAAAAPGGEAAPSRMERIQTLSRAYSSIHAHGVPPPSEVSALEEGQGQAPSGGPGASAAEEGEGEGEGEEEFDLETRVKNLEAIEAAEPWRPKVSQMIRAFKGPEEIEKMKLHRMRKYYRRQNALLEFYEEKMLIAACEREGGGQCVQLPPLVRKRRAAAEEESGAERKSFLARLAINLSFCLNVSLVALKILALVLSGSVAMLASVVDSCLDLLSGLVLFLTRRSIDRKEYYNYPQGKKRLEPVGVLVFATCMALASLQIIVEAVGRIVDGATGKPHPVTLGIAVNFVVIYTIAGKLLMGLVCQAVAKRTGSSAVRAYGIDHWNDVASNLLGIAGMVLAAEVKMLWWMDPTVAIAISLFILLRWAVEGLHHIGHVVGKVARPVVLKKLAFLACNVHESVVAVETTLAYHFGERVLAEVDVVLPPSMALKEAHDVGQKLQNQIEALEEVERGFVHLDVSTAHAPEHVIKD